MNPGGGRGEGGRGAGASGAAGGVCLLGTGSAVPPKRLTNHDLAAMMDTSDEWIVQRTGIRERRVVDREGKGECTRTLAIEALRAALADAGLKAPGLDLIVLATMTPEMTCPPTACRVAAGVGAGNVGAFEVGGACCGFVFALNTACGLIRSGMHRTVAVVGADTVSRHVRYDNVGRGTAILFGDAAGAVILQATDDASKGLLAHAMHSDGESWGELFVPRHRGDFPEGREPDDSLLNTVLMNGRTVFRFAVETFQELIAQTLDKARLNPEDVDHYICHQSNARILHAARERFGIPEEKMHVNIDRYGNTVAGSVPLCLDELRRAGRIREGQTLMFVAFGGGLTWGSSLWRV
jgi:3-oxoacyl-[acyl-carrier-protein] synthase III